MSTTRKKKFTADPRQPAEVERRILTSQEAALYLGVTERWVRRAVAEKRIPYVKVGKLLRFHTDDLDGWVESRRVPAER